MRRMIVCGLIAAVSVAQTSSLPAMFDYGTFPGDPDLVSSGGTSCSTSAQGTFLPSGGTVAPGVVEQAGDRIRKVIYLDGIVSEAGESPAEALGFKRG